MTRAPGPLSWPLLGSHCTPGILVTGCLVAAGCIQVPSLTGTVLTYILIYIKPIYQSVSFTRFENFANQSLVPFAKPLGPYVHRQF